MSYPFNLRVAAVLTIIDVAPSAEVTKQILQFLSLHETNTIVYFRAVEHLKTVAKSNPSVLGYDFSFRIHTVIN